MKTQTLCLLTLRGAFPSAAQSDSIDWHKTARGKISAIDSTLDFNGGLEWQNDLNTEGTIEVVATTGAAPQFSSVVLSGSGVIFSGSGGASNGSYVLLSSTNVAIPLVNWVPVATNPFDANGGFLFTNPINPTQPQEFFRLLEP